MRGTVEYVADAGAQRALEQLVRGELILPRGWPGSAFEAMRDARTHWQSWGLSAATWALAEVVCKALEAMHVAYAVRDAHLWREAVSVVAGANLSTWPSVAGFHVGFVVEYVGWAMIVGDTEELAALGGLVGEGGPGAPDNDDGLDGLELRALMGLARGSWLLESVTEELMSLERAGERTHAV